MQNLLNGKEIARARVENAKKAILAPSQELGRRLRGVLPLDSPYLKALPELPTQTAAQEMFLAPIKDYANIWKRLDDDGTDLVLSENYTLAKHTAELTELAALYTTLSTAMLDLKISREKRNKLQTDAREVLSAYRPAVEGTFPPDSPLVKTIPLIYPPAGHTPDAVVATAVYDEAVNFTESTEAELKEYQVRAVPGPEYDTEDEVLLGTIPKGAPRNFRTGFTLTAPGTAASLKVYVVLNTGNEAGSKPVTVERP